MSKIVFPKFNNNLNASGYIWNYNNIITTVDEQKLECGHEYKYYSDLLTSININQNSCLICERIPYAIVEYAADKAKIKYLNWRDYNIVKLCESIIDYNDDPYTFIDLANYLSKIGDEQGKLILLQRCKSSNNTIKEKIRKLKEKLYEKELPF